MALEFSFGEGCPHYKCVILGLIENVSDHAIPFSWARSNVLSDALSSICTSIKMGVIDSVITDRYIKLGPTDCV